MPWRLQRFANLGSTNEQARELALAGCPEGLVVRAETQTNGRGRMNRAWHSRRGQGLWLSVVLRPRVEMRRLPQLTLVTAVAVSMAVEVQTGLAPAIKWPNDLLLKEGKLCGILCEIVDPGRDEDEVAVIVGIGLNVNQRPGAFPVGLQNVATSLRIATGRSWDRNALQWEMLGRLGRLYRAWRDKGFGDVRTQWIARSETLGTVVRLDRGGCWLQGTARTLDQDGALVVETEHGGVHRVDSGEIHGPCSPDNNLKSKEY